MKRTAGAGQGPHPFCQTPLEGAWLGQAGETEVYHGEITDNP
jgi:hypothetical protein